MFGRPCRARSRRQTGFRCAIDTVGGKPETPKGYVMTATALQRANEKADAAKAGLSIIVPVYNEAAGLASLHARIAEVARALRSARGLACEVVYVDDGSRDDSFSVARSLPANGIDVQVVSLSRNFGKEAALLAGLDHARRGA